MAAAIAVRDEERRRLAEAVHDKAVQSLAAVSLQLEWAVETATYPGQAALLRRLAREARAATEGLRDVIYELVPLDLEAGLADGVRSMANRVSRSAGLDVDVDITLADEPTRMVGEAIYRSIQELLANVEKHAQAKNVRVRIATIGDEIHAVVADDGVGMASRRTPVSGSGGTGLRLVRERLALVSGRVSISSQPGAGAVAEVWVPMSDNAP